MAATHVKAMQAVVADDTTWNVSAGDVACFCISNASTGDGAMFFADYDDDSTEMLSNISGTFNNYDDDGNADFYTSYNTTTHVFKNRLGTSQTFRIAIFSTG